MELVVNVPEAGHHKEYKKSHFDKYKKVLNWVTCTWSYVENFPQECEWYHKADKQKGSYV